MCGILLINIIVQKLDDESRKHYEMSLSSNVLPDFENYQCVVNNSDQSQNTAFNSLMVAVERNDELVNLSSLNQSGICLLPTTSVFGLSSVGERGQIKELPNQPVAQNTIFGWVLAGKMDGIDKDMPICSNLVGMQSDSHLVNVDLTLEKFWHSEELPNKLSVLSEEEKFCEAHCNPLSNNERIQVPPPKKKTYPKKCISEVQGFSAPLLQNVVEPRLKKQYKHSLFLIHGFISAGADPALPGEGWGRVRELRSPQCASVLLVLLRRSSPEYATPRAHIAMVELNRCRSSPTWRRTGVRARAAVALLRSRCFGEVHRNMPHHVPILRSNMVKKYVVVRFMEEVGEPVEVIASAWLIGDRSCPWPTGKSILRLEL
ncbi:hypothetical protein JTE90_018214 [Oedothorax gibbosus]|uniref:Uncharacterized protein n=1 Tax=Oedothorax gibbosus TaxID=931172 RepID=A0AAV6UAD3_9ARAC|nr:hypothetical protein JTE90_018214 [Oedothorax gibbosus]